MDPFKVTEQSLAENEGLATLTQWLEEKGIPLEEWGHSGKKDVADLLKEIEDGETQLFYDEETKQVVRLVSPIATRIFYVDEVTGEKLELIEAVQVFAIDQSERRRKLEGAVAEKGKIGENPADSVARGILEELGKEIDPSKIHFVKKVERTDNTGQSYPGIISTYSTTVFETEFDEEQFVPNNKVVALKDGDLWYAYKEEQTKKTTYFAWVAAE